MAEFRNLSETRAVRNSGAAPAAGRVFITTGTNNDVIASTHPAVFTDNAIFAELDELEIVVAGKAAQSEVDALGNSVATKADQTALESLEAEVDDKAPEIEVDTAANFTSTNPVLLAGQFGLESDRERMKIGDGVTDYNALNYAVIGLLAQNLIDLLDDVQTAGGGTYSTLASFFSSYASDGGSALVPATPSNIRVGTPGFLPVVPEEWKEAHDVVTLTETAGAVAIDGADFFVAQVVIDQNTTVGDSLSGLDEEVRVLWVQADGGNFTVTPGTGFDLKLNFDGGASITINDGDWGPFTMQEIGGQNIFGFAGIAEEI